MEKKLTEQNILHLFSFLIDDQPTTVDLAKQQLRSLLHEDPDIVLFLEQHPHAPWFRAVQTFFDDLRFDQLQKIFMGFHEQRNQVDLEEGVYRLATVAYPAFKKQDLTKALDRMAQDVDELLDFHDASPDEAIDILRRYLFEEKGFRGNTEHYYDPDNSYINRVLERRLGIPITLCCVYLLITKRLDMPAYGVGLPGHFVIAHEVYPNIRYLDPYNGGRELTRKDCEAIVRQSGVAFKQEFLRYTPPPQILARIMVNLINVYSEQGNSRLAHRLTQLLDILQ